MIALPILSASIGILLGVARFRVTALFAAVCVLIVTLVLCSAVGGVDNARTIAYGIVAAIVLQLGYVFAIAARAFRRGPAADGEAQQLRVSRLR
jgi:hypothetical protein